MFDINVQADLKPLQTTLSDLAKKQIPFATARALTAVAKRVQGAEKEALSEVFDRPTLFTQRSIGVTAAKKADLTATVFVKDIAAQYLEPFETGGQHHLPPSKRGGTLFNPKAVDLNQYGNLPKGKLRRLAARPDTFVGTINFRSGQTVSGVWRRPKRDYRRADPKRGYWRDYGTKGKLRKVDGVLTGLKLLVRFGDALPVKQRLGYRERAKDVVRASLKAEFDKAMGAALATARK
ncbi:hypothetical protein D3877_01870 [Azospirillum cavernae]|uniref:Uncharacterized protein n=1 Tax=Azospirillum cavernae TaxID=2320860 RepID=A0A418W0A7_9PROT|nr:hypothetical protein [Azospirillum cavernae]RJF83443.1 hypothetical protein D3877_01870 [Azospirillum cavernae]